ncbi:MAG: hypothetical protein IJC74_05860 [Clostridia bacterium]|nr:hypothetical protein [Clostridia bacterium]
MCKGKIIKNNRGELYYFFIDNNGLCYKSVLKEQKSKVILSNAVFDFDVSWTDGGFSVICQNDEGSIIYLKEKNGIFLKNTLFYNKNGITYKKYFKILIKDNIVNAFYIINIKEKNMLVYHRKITENSRPEIIDYVTDCNYYAYIDSENNINVVYNNENINFAAVSETGVPVITNSMNGNFICGMYHKEKLYSVLKSDKIYMLSDGTDTVKAEFLKNCEFVIPYFIDDIFSLMYIKNGKLYQLKAENLKQLASPLFIATQKRTDIFSVELPGGNIKTDYSFGYLYNSFPRLFLINELLKLNYIPVSDFRNEQSWKNEILLLESHIRKLEKNEQELKNKIIKIEDFLIKLYEMNNEI